MILRELLASTPVFEIIGRRRIDIKGIALLPQDVKKGYLYIYKAYKLEIPYEHAISLAMENGAVAIVIGKDHEIPENNITFIRTYHYRRFLSAVSRNFYNNPSQNMRLVGITGSHGKTTVGWMIKSILNISGITGIMLGADYCQLGDHSWDPYPDGINPLNMNKLLYKAVKEEVRWGIIECAYTGIVEDRFSHIWFNSIIYTDLFTYFQNQKADYHYFEMRKALIDHLKTTQSPVIVNVDDFYAFHLERDSTIGYGLLNEANITARQLVLAPEHSCFILVTPQGQSRVKLNIPGIHNVYNALAAAGWGLAEGLDLDDIVEGIQTFKGMPGPKDPIALRGNIYIKDIPETTPDEIYGVFEGLKKEDIVTVLCLDDTKDIDMHKKLCHIIGQHSISCIMVYDYFSNSGLVRNGSEYLDEIGNAMIHRQIDYFKAIQKAVTFLPHGGHILLIRG